jgi:hypothetical protein
MQRILPRFSLLLALAGAALPGCSPSSSGPEPLKELVLQRSPVDLSRPDPDAPFWKEIPEGYVPLMAQPMINPKPASNTTEGVFVKAATDGTRAAFHLRWKDPEKSEAGRLGEFSDAIALQFPVKDGPPPSIMMGAKGSPVHIFHWRAQYQRDKDRGKPDMKALYPNGSIDMYPMEFKEAASPPAAEAEKFSPGRVAGNPQSYEKTGVDEIIAEGFSTSSVQEGNGSVAHGVWAAGEWRVVIVRPLAVEGGSTLKAGGDGNMAFAIWQGGKDEVGSRKCLTLNWIPLKVK